MDLKEFRLEKENEDSHRVLFLFFLQNDCILSPLIDRKFEESHLIKSRSPEYVSRSTGGRVPAINFKAKRLGRERERKT